MAWTQDKVNEVYSQVQKLAATDEAFRAELLNNPTAAIERISGEALPENYKIKVIDNDPGYSTTFVLPAMTSGELSGDELDGIAGGDIVCNKCN